MKSFCGKLDICLILASLSWMGWLGTGLVFAPGAAKAASPLQAVPAKNEASNLTAPPIPPGISTNSSSGEVVDTSDPLLKGALADAQKKLGQLETWQKVIYSDEIIPQAQRFVRNYRALATGLQVDVDFDTLKRYLAFYGPRSLKQKEPKILVFYKSDPNCSKCNESSAGIRRLVFNRLTRRGLTPIVVAPADIPSSNDLSSLEEGLISLAQEKEAAGTLIVQWSPAPVGDSDSAHADEQRYLVQIALVLGEYSLPNRTKELLNTDRFESFIARLLTDIFTDVGAKVQWNEINLAESGREEILIEIVGIQNFAQFNEIKTAIQARFQDASLEERKLSQNKITFAIYTKEKTESLKKELSEMKFNTEGGQPLSVVVR